jgi:hypothetical protein
MTVPDLIRFLNAQAQVYSRVIADLTDGRTRTHWIWFILLVESASAEVLEVEDPAHRRPVELPPPFDVMVTTSVRSPRATWIRAYQLSLRFRSYKPRMAREHAAQESG